MRIRFRLRRLVSERGFSLTELLMTMAIMGVVLGGLTTVFVSGSKAELDTNRRFQAQADGRLALDKLRTDIHCSRSATTTSSTVTLTIPAGSCRTASDTNVTWCTSAVGASTTRYALYRYLAGTCTSGVRWADYLTQASAFTFTQQSSASLAKVRAYLPINPSPGRMRTYALQDDIYLRNSTRTCVTGSPSPPC